MTHLWVLYDSTCPFCAWCREWLEQRVQLVPLRFVCCRSETARTLFGGLPLVSEMVVVDSRGRWWAGPPAFAMCLWALESWRDHALRMTDGWWWAAEPVFQLISDHRDTLGVFLGVDCPDGTCAAPPVGMYR